MTISVRLDEETEKKLNWLLQDINKEPKAYSDQTVSDIIRTAINNEWVTNNVEHYTYDEINDCDPLWLEKTKPIIYEKRKKCSTENST